MNGIGDQVYQYLTHLYRVCFYQRQLSIRSLNYFDTTALIANINKIQDVRHNSIEIDQAYLSWHLPREDHQLFNNLSCIERCFDDTIHVAILLLTKSAGLFHQLSKTENSSYRFIQLMCNTG